MEAKKVIKNKKMLLPIFDIDKGKKIKELDISIFFNDIRVSPLLIHQALVTYQSKKIKPSHTKTRGEVRGGGAKPWRQKGTGRARQGSIRSPLWKGGGVVFGPRKEENKIKRIPKKMKRKAILGVIRNKIETSSLILVEKLNLKERKTKEALKKIENLPIKEEGSKLLIFSREEKEDIKPFRNLKEVKVTLVDKLNIYDLLESSFLVFTKKAFDKILTK